MAADTIGRVGILWRGDRAARTNATAENNRLRPLFEALANLNVAPEPVVFGDNRVHEVRDQLLQLDGVLVWVDPIMGDEDRAKLDGLLKEVSSAGVWVSADPDVILKMGTKEVLFRTRDLSWGGDVYLYETYDEFREEFPGRLASAGPRVVKQNRGNGGIGVWKVELTDSSAAEADGARFADATVRVQHALPRDTMTEDLRLADFMGRCAEYFSGAGRMVDQPFQPRIVEGMIRCYMVQDEVVGFAHQWPDGLTPDPLPGGAPPASNPRAGADRRSPPDGILGLPSKKTMYGAAEPQFNLLRAQMEAEWIPGMQRLVDVGTESLPLLWDADFLYGPRTPAGEDTYVLCEINVSSVLPFPEQAVARLAQSVVARLVARKQRGPGRMA